STPSAWQQRMTKFGVGRIPLTPFSFLVCREEPWVGTSKGLLHDAGDKEEVCWRQKETPRATLVILTLGPSQGSIVTNHGEVETRIQAVFFCYRA
ncbi:hypothetical protein RRG08_065910, partial [Elysia crispata]